MKAFVREQIFLTWVLLWNLGSVIKIKLHLAVDKRKHCLSGRHIANCTRDHCMSTFFYSVNKICRNGAVLWQITEMKLLNVGCLGSQALSYPSLLVLQHCLERSYSIVTRECFINSSRCSSDKF